MTLLVLAPHIEQGFDRRGVVLQVELIDRRDAEHRYPVLLHGGRLIGYVGRNLDAEHVIVPGALPLLLSDSFRRISSLAERNARKERSDDKKREGGP